MIYNDNIPETEAIIMEKRILKPIYENGKWGFADENGTVVIPCRWDDVCDFHEGLAGVQWDGKWGYIDKTGELVIPCEFGEADDFHEGLAHVVDWSYCEVGCVYDEYFIDHNGDIVGEINQEIGPY